MPDKPQRSKPERCSIAGCLTIPTSGYYCTEHQREYVRAWRRRQKEKNRAHRKTEREKYVTPYDQIEKHNDGNDIPEPGRGIVIHGIRLFGITHSPPAEWLDFFIPPLGTVKKKILERGYRVTGLILRPIKTHPPR